MGNLLTALIADSGTVPPANPANLRISQASHPERFADSQDSQPARDPETVATVRRFADSQDSQGLAPSKPEPEPDTEAIRARLLELARAAFMEAAPVRALSDTFLHGCHGMADDALRGLLSMLRDDTERRAGRAPEGETAAILCQSCGPGFAPPSVAAVLPVVDGWPRALGCPWCFIRKAGLYVPRPSVTCATCVHWHPDAINPEGGRGQCACGSFWPAQRHACGQYRPAPSNEGNT